LRSDEQNGKSVNIEIIKIQTSKLYQDVRSCEIRQTLSDL
jgi:hypothetical protein